VSIKYAILGLLSWKPATGYEVKKIFKSSSIIPWSGSNNQIYNTLLDLQCRGLVTYEILSRKGYPSKKTYTITSEGLSELKEWLQMHPQAPEFKKTFLIQLSWSHLLNDQELFELLKKYESEINRQLATYQENMKLEIDAPKRTFRETIIWNMISENLISSYKSELEWVEKTHKAIFGNEADNWINKISFQLIKIRRKSYLEVLTCTTCINSEQEALELIDLCREYKTNLLMIHSAALSNDFFKLQTGVAHKIQQMFNDSNIRACVLIPRKKSDNRIVMEEKYNEIISDTNIKYRFGVYDFKRAAESWLLL